MVKVMTCMKFDQLPELGCCITFEKNRRFGLTEIPLRVGVERVNLSKMEQGRILAVQPVQGLPEDRIIRPPSHHQVFELRWTEKFGRKDLPSDQVQFFQSLLNHLYSHVEVLGDMPFFIVFIAVDDHQALSIPRNAPGRKPVFGQAIPPIPFPGLDDIFPGR